MHVVCVVNGFPRAGKDTTITLMGHALQDMRVPHRSFSSIEPVRTMLRWAGYPVDRKTPEMRALLAEVGDAVEKFNYAKTHACLHVCREFFTIWPRAVVFLHTREPEIIARLKNFTTMSGENWRFRTVLVQRPGTESDLSNAADRNVMAWNYDAVIRNDGSIRDLEGKAHETARWLLD